MCDDYCPTPPGPFELFGRAVDNFLESMSTTLSNITQILIEAEHQAETGRNPYTALAAIEAHHINDAHDRLDALGDRLGRSYWEWPDPLAPLIGDMQREYAAAFDRLIPVSTAPEPTDSTNGASS